MNDPENTNEVSHNRAALLLSQILLLQRWAGKEINLATIFGLQHGVESVVAGLVPKGISRETQRKIEDILQAVAEGKQEPDGISIKDRLRQEEIDKADADTIMQLCVLQGRFGDAVAKIAESSAFMNLLHQPTAPTAWQGASFYIELVDDTEDQNQLWTVFSPCVPRVGEVIQPDAGSELMEVVAVKYVMAPIDDPLDTRKKLRELVPLVIPQSVEPATEGPDGGQ